MATSAADHAHEARERLAAAVTGIDSLGTSIDNLVRYLNYPRHNVRKAKEHVAAAAATLGATQEGERLLQLLIRYDLIMGEMLLAMANLKDEQGDLLSEVSMVRDNVGRWEGNLRG